MSFHVFKVDRIRQASERPKRRRRRQTVSCMACRQLKVSCDRQAPCNRCVLRRKADECIYTDNRDKPTQNGPEMTLGPTSSDTGESPTLANKQTCRRQSSTASSRGEGPWYTPKSALRGATHWASMLHQFQDVLPDNKESRTILETYIVHGFEGQKTANHVFPSENFPFTCFGSHDDPSFTKSDIMAQMPDRRMCDLFVEHYLRSAEGACRLFHIPSLRSEIDDFLEDPLAATYDWLAQFFMVITLGHDALKKSETSNTGDTTCSPVRQSLLEAAEKCLSRTSVMFRANITLIRCLCLAVIIKLTSVYQCSVIDSCGTLTDMAVRGCLELGLHESSDQFGDLDQQVRARLWATAIFLKMQQALNSGTPLLLRRSDLRHFSLKNLDDDELCNDLAATERPALAYTDSTCQIIIARALPIAVDVISAANASDQVAITLDHHQTKIEALLQEVQRIYDGSGDGDKYSWRKFQRPMLEIYLRRIQFVMHQTSLSLPSGDLTKSYFQKQFLGSALAILVHQRQIMKPTECPAIKMVGELHKQDFFIAAIGACATLRNSQQVLESLGLGHPMRETIRVALYWCMDLWASHAHLSTCNYWAYLILKLLIDRKGV